MHLVEIVLRLSLGQRPHQDFMTPIGLFATEPMALFVRQGMGIGQAVLAAQALVALLLLPAVWWAGVSRLAPGWAALFGAVCLLLVAALVHGEAERSLSVSMHYNRWAWAVAFAVIVVAVVPPRRMSAPVADGLVLGLGLAVLALMKATYAVALLPTVLLALALRRDRRAFATGLGAGLAVLAAVTLWQGVGFWPAYVGDLLAVARSDIRGAPGDSLVAVIAAPAWLGGSLVALAGVMLLRQAGRTQEGLLLMTLLPGFFVITWQNYGNDPQWLYLVGVLLMALRPAAGTVNGLGWDMRQALALCGLAAFALGLPSALNLASSPLRHLALDRAGYVALFPGAAPPLDDIAFRGLRADRVLGRAPLPGFPPAEAEPAVLNGETLADCQLDSGTTSYLAALGARLAAGGHGGRAILVADLFSSLWGFGDFPPLPGGAPWYYGGLPGGAAAELMLVPACPVLPRARRAVLEAAAAEGWTLVEIARDPLFILTEIQRPATMQSTR
jgi:hypothetical protein